MQKNNLFSVQIELPLANALKSIGYTDTVQFLTIGMPDVCRHINLEKLATKFYPII
jgi:hypothetical protein